MRLVHRFDKLVEKNFYRTSKLAGFIAFFFSVVLSGGISFYGEYTATHRNVFSAEFWQDFLASFFVFYAMFFLLWMVTAILLSLVLGISQRKLELRRILAGSLMALSTQLTWSTFLVVIMFAAAFSKIASFFLLLLLMLLFKAQRKTFYLLLMIGGLVVFILLFSSMLLFGSLGS